MLNRMKLLRAMVTVCLASLLVPRSFAGPEDALEQMVRQRVVELEGQRRERARMELEDLRRKRETLESRIEYARRTVLQTFGLADREVIATPARNPKTLQQLKRRRDLKVFRVLEFRRDSAGMVANGDALNVFVELCGSTAFGDIVCKKNAPASASAPGPGPARLGARQANPANGKLFNEVTETYRIPGDVLEHICYQRGLAGPRLSGRLNRDPLDTDWPAILRTELFQRRTQDIEARRATVMQQLRGGKPVSSKTADGLLDAVNDLLAAVEEAKVSLMRQIREDGSNRRAQTDWHRLSAAQEQLRILLAGAYRLIEARTVGDVSLPPLNFKNGVTVEELLAYMHENNLYFNPADANGQYAYNVIFEMLTRYYIDLTMLKNTEDEIRAIKTEEGKMKEIMLGNKMDNLQESEIAVARLKSVTRFYEALIAMTKG